MASNTAAATAVMFRIASRIRSSFQRVSENGRSIASIPFHFSDESDHQAGESLKSVTDDAFNDHLSIAIPSELRPAINDRRARS